MRILTTLCAALLFLVACVPIQPVAEEAMTMPAESMARATGATVTSQAVDDIVVHSYLAPEQVFASNTHIIELANSLVVIDTQFLLPNALDFRAYADSLGKPIERVIITHAHPDHFLGSEAFADVDVYALAEVAALIEANGQAEVDEKQADFGEAIASTYVVPMVLEPGTVAIDGVAFEFEVVNNAEAEIQVVVKVPEYGVIAVGDIVYSGIHMILAGRPPTWTAALEALKAESTNYPLVLPGHGVTTDASVYDVNIAWLAKAGELMGTATTGEEFKAGMVDTFPDLGLPGAIDFVLPFLFPSDDSGALESDQAASTLGLIEVITVALADGAAIEDFLPANEAIDENYASQQPGYLSRETAVSADGQILLAVYWESKADSDNSIAGFGEAPGLGEFMAPLNAETMVIKQYEIRSGSDQVVFPGSGAIEVITLSLNEGADVDGFLAANDVIREEYTSQQPGYIGRQTGVTEDGEWAIIVHWESASDSAASIAGFESAPGIDNFLSFIDMESMVGTVYEKPTTVAMSNGEIAAALLNSLPTGDTTVVETYVAPDYIQHNPGVPTGRDALLGMVNQMANSGMAVNVVRVLEDGDYAVTHTDAGQAALFDVFRFENGMIVEHWDNIQEVAGPNPSGHTMFDGPTEVTDLDKTEENRALVTQMIDDVLIQGNGANITNYISTETYIQHNPGVADGLEGFGEAMAAMAEQGISMEYYVVHHVIAEGNFVLSIAEGAFGGEPTSFYDLFRIEDGLIVEHWDVIETILPEDQWQNENGKFNFPDGPVVE